MKTLIQYRFSCENAMFNYLKDGDSDALITKLREIESQVRGVIGGESGELWFKFGNSDTLATDISDIERDINLPSSHNNKKLLVESFELVIGLNPTGELRVFYS